MLHRNSAALHQSTAPGLYSLPIPYQDQTHDFFKISQLKELALLLL